MMTSLTRCGCDNAMECVRDDRSAGAVTDQHDRTIDLRYRAGNVLTVAGQAGWTSTQRLAAGASSGAPKPDGRIDNVGYQHDNADHEQIEQALRGDADDTEDNRHDDEEQKNCQR